MRWMVMAGASSTGEAHADDVASAAAGPSKRSRATSETDTASGFNFLHFTLMIHAYMIQHEYDQILGKSRARDAAMNAIQSPLLDIGIDRATGIVWNITGGLDLTLFEVNAAAEVIYDLVDPNANLIFGAVVDESFSGQVSITLIATGFKGQDQAERASSKAVGRVIHTPLQPTGGIGTQIDVPEFLRRRGRARRL
ncbi:hypothetical protein L7F22_053819 [Adiantum nelumboides]|nr:hypothetical protein [Adiantum nelumboides]